MKAKIIFLLAVIVFCAACPAPCDVSESEAAPIQSEAAPIIQALESYRAARNNYPNSLDDLTPDYLREIPKTLGGRVFQYNRNSEKEYFLRIASRNGGFYSGSCTYSEINGKFGR
jgi:hypothetical protein